MQKRGEQLIGEAGQLGAISVEEHAILISGVRELTEKATSTEQAFRPDAFGYGHRYVNPGLRYAGKISSDQRRISVRDFKRRRRRIAELPQADVGVIGDFGTRTSLDIAGRLRNCRRKPSPRVNQSRVDAESGSRSGQQRSR